MPKRKPVMSPMDPSTPTRSNARSRAAKSTAESVETRVSKIQESQKNALQEEIRDAESRVDLAQVAGNIPAENLRQLATAVQSGRWLFAAWHVADGRLHLERTAANFPTVDLEKAVSMLAENLKELTPAS